jgi:hypothetical protein
LPPPVRPPPHTRPSPRRASPLSLVAWWRALPRLPQALPPPPPPRLWARGAKAATSRGEPDPHRSPPPPRLTTSTPRSRERRAPAARAAGTPHSSAPGAPAAGGFAPSCAPPAPAPAAALRARVLETGGWANQTARRLRPLSAKEWERFQDMTTSREPA